MNHQCEDCAYCDRPIAGAAYFVGGQPLHPTCAHEYGADLDSADEQAYNPDDFLPGDERDSDLGWDDDFDGPLGQDDQEWDDDDSYDDEPPMYGYEDEYQSYYDDSQAWDM